MNNFLQKQNAYLISKLLCFVSYIFCHSKNIFHGIMNSDTTKRTFTWKRNLLSKSHCGKLFLLETKEPSFRTELSISNSAQQIHDACKPHGTHKTYCCEPWSLHCWIKMTILLTKLLITHKRSFTLLWHVDVTTAKVFYLLD